MSSRFRQPLALVMVLALMPAARPPAKTAHSYVLPTPLSTLVQGHAFYDWVTSANGPEMLTPTGTPFTRRCTNTLACDAKKAKTYVSVSPAAQARELDAKHVPTNGVVVAYMIPDKNYGKYTEWRYHVPTAQDPVYIVVERDGNGAKWTAVQVNKKESIPLTTGAFLECPDGHEQDRSSLGGFGGCPTNHNSAVAALRVLSGLTGRSVQDTAVIRTQTVYKKAFPFDPYDDTALWVSCIYGCCIAEF